MNSSTSPVTLRLIAFPTSGNLPVFVGNEKGLFAQHGVAVDLETTPSSMYLAKNLVEGKFDIGSGAVDNVIAYQEGAGEIEIDREPDLFVFMGGTQVELSFVVAPEIETYEDLKGKTLALDALSTGFAFALYRMLDKAGLTPDDYTMVSVGSTPARWESVRDGEHAGTLLIDPFTGMARGAGFRVLESSLDTFTHYQGQVFTASRAWCAANRDTVVSFIQGYLAALAWLFDPANQQEASEILARNIPVMKPEAVAPAMKKLLDPRTGLNPKAEIDMAGLDTVLELRSQYAEQKKQLTDAAKYIDLSYYQAALAAG